MYIPPQVHVLRLFLLYPEYMFSLLRRKIQLYFRYRWIKKKSIRSPEAPPPMVYKLYLTLKCDLRCDMCMLWGNSGVLKHQKGGDNHHELEVEILERILKESEGRHPSFILSGGEPLLHSKFKEIAALFKKYKCFAYVCTNGTLIEKHLESISGNPYLIFYISLDGPRQINDRLRGEGVYDKVVRNIRALKALPRKPYVGVQVTAQKENIAYLYETCKEAVSLGADWVLINLRWFLSSKQASAYEEMLQREYGVSPSSHKGFVAPYDIDKEEFVRQCDKVRAARWPIQISSYLKKPEDIHAYVDQPEVNPYNNFCYKEWIRMDVLPDGQVTPCIQYPDITFGSLKEKTVMEVWNSEGFKQFRSTICKRPLPVCGKCYCLYLYDANRAVL